jgi:hypothetical protein
LTLKQRVSWIVLGMPNIIIMVPRVEEGNTNKSGSGRRRSNDGRPE